LTADLAAREAEVVELRYACDGYLARIESLKPQRLAG
jgi:hypothetical protein